MNKHRDAMRGGRRSNPWSAASIRPAWTRAACLLVPLLWLPTALPVAAEVSPALGDLDGDGTVTVLDLARLVGYIRGSAVPDEVQRSVADLNGDGALNSLDREEMVRTILGTRDLASVPLCRVSGSSPTDGARDVAVTRETVLRFSCPLAPGAAIGPDAFFAEFGGRRLLSRVELSGDRRQVTLFYLEPLPSKARVRVTLDGTGLVDLLGRAVDLDGEGAGGGLFRMEFDTLGNSAVANTGIVGRVFASELGQGAGGEPVDVPLAGVTITVDGAEETLRAVTDAQGNFVLSPCPAGTFFVHIDGRTSPESAWPGGGYYPVVGKKWHALAGRTDNPAGEPNDTPDGATGIVYLPYVAPGSLQAVSTTVDTEISFPAAVLAAHPELEGVMLRVPANSLYANDGTRGGMVGIAPVPPDRLPGPLPPGLASALVITIQTDGATNFDRPVPVRFPNLPDPLTGRADPPGTPRSLASFNHDTGEWEVVGSATVSDDGRFVDSDAGSGIRQPGWHLPPLPRSPARWPGAREPGDSPPDDCGGEEFQNRMILVYELLKASMQSLHPLVAIEGIPDRLVCAQDWVTQVATIRTTATAAHDSLEEGTLSEAQLDAAVLNLVDLLAALAEAEDCARDPEDPEGASVVDEVLKWLKDAQRFLDWAGSEMDEAEVGETCVYVKLTDELKSKIGVVNATMSALQADLTAVPALNSVHVTNAVNMLETAAGNALEDEVIADALHGTADAAADLAGASMILGVVERNRAIVQEVEALLVIVSEILEGLSVAAAGDTYWALDFGTNDFTTGDPDTIVLRGRLAAGDELREWVPTGVPFFMNAYRHDGTRLGWYAGVTKGNNQETNIPATLVLNEWETDKIEMPPEASSELLTGQAIYRFADNDLKGDVVVGDNIPEGGEFVVGFDPLKWDTDGDGTGDGEALASALPTVVGVIETLGTAENDYWDIAAGPSLVVTGNGAGGISRRAGGFTRFRLGSAAPWSASRERHVELTDQEAAVAVAVGKGHIAVVASPYAKELKIVPIEESEDDASERTIKLDGIPTCVTALRDMAFVGLTLEGTTSRIDVFDLPSAESGEAPDTKLVRTGQIADLAISRGVLYAVCWTATGGRLDVIPLPNAIGEGLYVERTVSFPGSPPPRRTRIGVGNERLYVSTQDGLAIFDTSTPRAPTLLTEPPVPNLFWKQLVPNGSGLAVGLASTVSVGEPESHSIYLFNLGSEEQLLQFLYEIPTPGVPQAVALNNGYAYVAELGTGLHVVNYLGFDTQGVAPVIQALDTNFLDGVAGEGALMRLTARVWDDFQVQRVEFSVDGELIATDVTFPFETLFRTPTILDGVEGLEARDSITIKVEAFDTAGNASTWEETRELVEDAVAPIGYGTSPAAASFLSSARHAKVSFSELIDGATLEEGLKLRSTGPDGVFGTADDTYIAVVISFRDESKIAVLDAEDYLPPGKYRIEALGSLKDPAGNALVSPLLSEFEVYDPRDSDGDGLPDALELRLGYNPHLVDTDGNGIPDGKEDFDGDGLSNTGELLLGTDPEDPDSNGNGILDGDEDRDGDGLSDGEEIRRGTNPFVADTDGDGWNDEAEVTAGSDPLDLSSTPLLTGGGLCLARPARVFHRRTESDVLAPGVVATTGPARVWHKRDEADVLAAGVTDTRAAASATGGPPRVLHLRKERDVLAPGAIDTRAGGPSHGQPARVLHLWPESGPLAPGTTTTIPWPAVPPTPPDP